MTRIRVIGTVCAVVMALLSLLVITLSLIVLWLIAFPEDSPQTTPAPIQAEKDYTGVAVKGLPLDEQIKIAGCVKLSSIVNWGEGGMMYGREVTEAFLFGVEPYGHFPWNYDDFPPPKRYSPWEKRNEVIAFLHQRFYPCENKHIREASIYAEGAVWGIRLVFDREFNLISTGWFIPIFPP
ncbi:MAG: hypothetical protein KGZ50_03190 [Peptococcaceae bacterium]|nr:hypothetical protein [Peptococcaceae bacterium]